MEKQCRGCGVQGTGSLGLQGARAWTGMGVSQQGTRVSQVGHFPILLLTGVSCGTRGERGTRGQTPGSCPQLTSYRNFRRSHFPWGLHFIHVSYIL